MIRFRHLIANIAIMLVAIALASIQQRAYAQAPLVNTYSNSVIKGYSSSALIVNVAFTGACTGGVDIAVQLPQGIEYANNFVLNPTLPSGFNGQNTSSQLTVVYNPAKSTITRPVFTVSGAIAIGNSVSFSFNRKATCSSVQGGVFDQIFVTSTNSCAEVSLDDLTDAGVTLYNIYSPVLSMSAPTQAISAAIVGDTLTRTLTVVNGGANSAVDTLFYYIVYRQQAINNNSGTNAIKANNVTFTPYRTSGDTLFYKFYGANLFTGSGSSNSLLEDGESVLIEEPIVVKKCSPNNSTFYAVSYGSSQSAICTPATTTEAVHNMALGSGTLVSASSNILNYTNACNTPIQYRVNLVTGYSGNIAMASINNAEIRLGRYGTTGLESIVHDLITISNPKLRLGDGTLIPLNAITSTISNLLTIRFANYFTTDPDGVGGIEDLDGDGFYDDILPGSTISIVYDMNLNNTLDCGTKSIRGYNVALAGTTACGNNTNYGYKEANGVDVDIRVAGNAHLPANIEHDEVFLFNGKLTISSNDNSFRRGSNTRYKWTITLPPGIQLATNANAIYGSTPVTLTQAGNVITYISTNDTLSPLKFNLKADCGLNGQYTGNKVIEYTITEINNQSANCEGPWSKILCGRVSTILKCASACIVDGPIPSKPIIRRAAGSIGWVNNSLTTRRTRDQISTYDLSKALFLDTIEIIGNAVQNGPASNMFIDYQILIRNTVRRLTPIDVKTTVIRGGAPILSDVVTTSPALNSATTSLQSILWELPIPSGGFLSGDSVQTVSRYVVATNESLQALDEQVGRMWGFFNINSNGDTLKCNDWTPEMYLVRTSTDRGINAFNIAGCSTTEAGGSGFNFSRQLVPNALNFENEFRPTYYIDSIVLTKTGNVDIPSTLLEFYGTGGISFNNANPNANRFTYINPGTWRLGSVATRGAQWPISIIPRLRPNCMTPATFNVGVEVFVRDYYYAYADGPGVPTDTTHQQYRYSIHPESINTIASTGGPFTQRVNYNNKPSLILSNITGEVQGTSPSHRWTVRLQTGNTSSIPNVWFALPNDPNIHVQAVAYKGNPLTPISYNGGNMYVIPGQILSNNLTQLVDIDFTYSSCVRDSIKLVAGWDCSGVPSTPAEFACTKSEMNLIIDPLPSEVQLVIEKQPGDVNGQIQLCSTDSAILLINSAQAALVINPYVTMVAPSGFTIPNTIQVEFPANSNIYEPVSVQLINGEYRINVFEHSGIGVNGLNGTATAPQSSIRQARIKLEFNTSCEYVSGTSFEFTVHGSRPCGSDANGSGVRVFTNRVRVAGINVTGTAGMTLDFGAATNASCGTTARLISNITPVGAGSSTEDTIVYTLPDGMKYAGNLSGIATNALVNGNIVKIGMPVTAASTTVVVGFDVIAVGEDCGLAIIDATFNRKITGLYCAATATTCNNSSVIIANATSNPIALDKPSLVINDVVVTAGRFGAGTYSADVTISNNGNVAAPANGYILEAYCGSNTTPFSVQRFPSAIAVNATVTANLNFTVPQSPVCNQGDYVTYTITPITSANDTQCLCAATSFISDEALPVKLINFTAIKNGNTAQLDWATASEQNNSGFNVEHSQDGIYWNSLGFVPTKAIQGNSSTRLDYGFDHKKPASGSNLYRLAQKDINGTVKYSMIRTLDFDNDNGIIIYPNPTKNRITIEGLSGDSEIRIFDAIGRLIISLHSDKTSEEVSLNDYSDGVYQVQIVEANGNIKTQKVVKNNY